MGLIFSLVKFLIKLLLYLAVFVTIVVLIPNLPPYTKFTSIPLEPTLDRTGPLAPNALLNNIQKSYEGKVIGPEAFQIYNGELYTSLATGEIVKVSTGGHVTFVTKIGKPCSGLIQEHICGRPLGFQIDEKTNTLYVADAYHGIWKVDLKTDKKQLLVSPQTPIEGREPKLFNSLALAQNGDLYWIDSTSDFQLKDGALSALADPSGRIFYYNAAKNQSKVVLDNLWFPNSIILSNDKQFILVTETFRYRVIKHYIEGPKKGKSEIFAAGLPGTPDNIRALPDDSGVLVALYTVFDDEHPLITRPMSETPVLRKFLARLQRLIEIPFEYLNNIYPHIIFEEIVYNIGHFQGVSVFSPPSSGVLQFDWNGKIVASYFNTDNSVRHISDAIVYNGNLYTGRPHSQNFMTSVPAPPALLKAFAVKKVQESKIPVVPKPEEKKDIPKVAKPVESSTSHVNSDATPNPSSQTVSDKKSTTGSKFPAPEKKTPPPNKETKPKSTESVKTGATNTKSSTKHTSTPETKPISKPASSQPKPTTNSENKPTAKSEDKPASKVESKPKPSPKQTTKQEAKPTPKQAKPTPKQEAKPISKQESKPTLNQETKPTLKQEAKPAVKQETKPTPKPETKSTLKPEDKATKSLRDTETKSTAAKQGNNNKKAETKKIDDIDTAKFAKLSKEIPIKEDILSDTKKPNTDKLKVIKKEGPTEIPNPK